MMNKLYKAAVPDGQYRFRANIFIWPYRTLFLGPLEQLEFHAKGAVTINVGLYQPFYMKTAGGAYAAYRCAAIPAGCKHELYANGNVVASLMLERNSIDFKCFKEQFKLSTIAFNPCIEQQWIACFQKIYEDKPSKAGINQLINQLLGVNAGMRISDDPRGERVMQLLKLDSGLDYNQEQLASMVGLSASRFRHLFSEYADMPFRRYKMWRRLILAIEIIHRGDNLTYAAMEAGFTDSAHFNRCFRDAFGVNPSFVFKNIDRFEI